jgi:hypothetical protein
MAGTHVIREGLFQASQVDERKSVARAVFQLDDHVWEITSERSLELGLFIIAVWKRESVRPETG